MKTLSFILTIFIYQYMGVCPINIRHILSSKYTHAFHRLWENIDLIDMIKTLSTFTHLWFEENDY
jgi:hypothetical protein